jgi:hypothetical protein
MAQSTNIQRLRKAGYDIKRHLPQEYKDVFDDLSEEEVSALETVKKKLEAAERKAPPEVAGYLAYLHPF